MKNGIPRSTPYRFVKNVLGLMFFLPGVLPVAAQPTAETVLQKSIAYHDPDGRWLKEAHLLTLRETRPDAEDRLTTLTLDYRTGGFAMRAERDGHVVEALWDGDTCTARLDGRTDIPDDLRERYRLSCEGIQWLHAYYGYMHSLPMNLRDPGTRLDPAAQTTTFEGREVLALRVTYDEAVGSDIWYFYVDLETYALVGCRFYHDEAKNDGEYIVFEEEVVQDGFRLPRVLKWYINEDGRFLGSDILDSIEDIPPD